MFFPEKLHISRNKIYSYHKEMNPSSSFPLSQVVPIQGIEQDIETSKHRNIETTSFSSLRQNVN